MYLSKDAKAAMWAPLGRKFCDQLQPTVNRPDFLLPYAKGKKWKITEKEGNNNIMHAELIGHGTQLPAHGDEEVSFDFKTSPTLKQPPRVGQWFFVSSLPGFYALGWYITPQMESPDKHLFALVSASELSSKIGVEDFYLSVNMLAVRSLVDCICMTALKPYESPQLWQAVQAVVQANKAHVQQKKPALYAGLVANEEAEIQRRTQEEHLNMLANNEANMAMRMNGLAIDHGPGGLSMALQR
jgi:hypothetical protein